MMGRGGRRCLGRKTT
ncbi:unnamed protein product [Brucella canis str. Oliveri]|nr:unnamed protein product [Brucella canis str. Oliveri]